MPSEECVYPKAGVIFNRDQSVSWWLRLEDFGLDVNLTPRGFFFLYFPREMENKETVA